MISFLKSKFFSSPATRYFIRTAWDSQVNSPWDFFHSYFYARWPYKYIALSNADHGAVQIIKNIFAVWHKVVPKKNRQKRIKLAPGEATGTMADIYHGKVLPVNNAQQLIMINEPVNLPDLEQVIPYQRARALILKNPDHILQVKCPCRMAKMTPCEPIDVCLVVGEPFTSMIHQHYPSRSKWISAQAACRILAEEDARGRVHHAFFSELMLGRFFAICNCCSCCCTAIQAHQRGTPLLAPSGYLARVDQGECTACFACEQYCQFGALSRETGATFIDQDLCMGCGLCISKCPLNAISLHLEPAKGVPFEICELIESASNNSITAN